MPMLTLTQEQRDLLFHSHELTVDICLKTAASNPEYADFYRQRAARIVASAEVMEQWPVGTPFDVDLDALDRVRGAMATLGHAVAHGTSKVDPVVFAALEEHLRKPFVG